MARSVRHDFVWVKEIAMRNLRRCGYKTGPRMYPDDDNHDKQKYAAPECGQGNQAGNTAATAVVKRSTILSMSCAVQMNGGANST
ncbi:hypothetical protein LMG26411_06850 [Cupriavidus numazuensis]|uniref:Transposase n=1 Tax=Cupriavidus numazuensis TaxID=221992 RepID=A0ABM8TT60_9BURK|nr:hypothetical protein LMG26411_06850 [Cupriavidus numazuensis]